MHPHVPPQYHIYVLRSYSTLLPQKNALERGSRAPATEEGRKPKASMRPCGVAIWGPHMGCPCGVAMWRFLRKKRHIAPLLAARGPAPRRFCSATRPWTPTRRQGCVARAAVRCARPNRVWNTSSTKLRTRVSRARAADVRVLAARARAHGPKSPSAYQGRHATAPWCCSLPPCARCSLLCRVPYTK